MDCLLAFTQPELPPLSAAKALPPPVAQEPDITQDKPKVLPSGSFLSWQRTSGRMLEEAKCAWTGMLGRLAEAGLESPTRFAAALGLLAELLPLPRPFAGDSGPEAEAVIRLRQVHCSLPMPPHAVSCHFPCRNGRRRCGGSGFGWGSCSRRSPPRRTPPSAPPSAAWPTSWPTSVPGRPPYSSSPCFVQ